MVKSSDEDMLANLARAFVNLGSSESQSRVMATQLLKRARQISADRDIPEAEALSELLEKVVQGRRGSYTGE
ncbi:MAG: hypothetical protein ACREIA_05445 [Opitutaceae bacterium]